MDSILSWEDADSWMRTVRALLNDAITDDVIEQFLLNPPEFVVSDDLSWLDGTLFDVTKKQIDSRTLLSKRLLGHYSVIRAYHACCPTELDSYRRDGVRLLDIENAHDFARQFFCGTAGVPLEDVEAAIRKQDASLRENRIWFGLDNRRLTQYCGHYLLYGSEYIVYSSRIDSFIQRRH